LTLSLAVSKANKLLHFTIWHTGSIKTIQIVTFQYLTLSLAVSKPYKLLYFNIWHFHWHYQTNKIVTFQHLTLSLAVSKANKLLHFNTWHFHWHYQTIQILTISIFDTFTGSIKTIQIVIFQYLTFSLALPNQ
jgi:hypothetical protein